MTICAWGFILVWPFGCVYWPTNLFHQTCVHLCQLVISYLSFYVISHWRARFYVCKKQKNTKRFYIQKGRHFAKNKILCKKNKTICITLYIHTARHFTLLDFSWSFWNWRRGEIFLYAKNTALCVTFLYAKKCTLSYVLYSKILTLYVTFLYSKIMHFALRFYI